MQRRCIAIIKLTEGTDLFIPIHTHKMWKTPRLDAHFFAQITQKAPHKNPVTALGQLQCTAVQITGNRKSHHGTHSLWQSCGFAPGVHQTEVPSHGKPHQMNTSVALLDRVLNHRMQILGRTTVIHARQTIGFSSTRAEIPSQGIKAMTIGFAQHPQHIRTAGMPLKSMRYDNQWPFLIAGTATPVQIQKITIR